MSFVHELGHALGYIGHSTILNYLMYHDAPNAPPDWIPITQDQISVLSTVYKEYHLDE